MFRHSFTSKRFLALLLSLAFLWSWAGCVSICAEVAARHDSAEAVKQNGRSAVTVSDKTDNCKITANAAVLSERQTVKTTALAVTVLPVLSFRTHNPAWTALLPEIKQNSPPKLSSPPIFVRLCTFRI